MDWIPAVSTTTLLAGVLWLARNLIATRLTNSVRHEYDEKLVTLNAKLTLLLSTDETQRLPLKADG